MIITGITPRDDNLDVMPIINAANLQIARLADGKSIRYININEELAFPDGALREGMSQDGLHLTAQAYQHWANALKPILTEHPRTAGGRGSRAAAHRRSERSPRQSNP